MNDNSTAWGSSAWGSSAWGRTASVSTASDGSAAGVPAESGRTPGAPNCAEIDTWIARAARIRDAAVDADAVSAVGAESPGDERAGDEAECAQAEGECLDIIRSLEEAKSALAAAQARVTASLRARRASRRAGQGVRAEERCAGLASEVALARRVSPVQGNRHLGTALALTSEMPHTLSALSYGRISEWKATLVVKETAVLSQADRAQVDLELAGQLETLGDKRAGAQARSIGYRLDPGSALRRVRGATADRRVGLRPAPDTMSVLTGVLPVAQGVACKTALENHADQRRSAGDDRTRAQIMADTLVERVTGQASAESVNIEVGLQMTADSLFGAGTAAGDQPAEVCGFGPVPADVGRNLVREADLAWIRRLYTAPETGELVSMDNRRRVFSGRMRELIIRRDQTCRTLWCDAPVRHIDHAQPFRNGGETSLANGIGLCEACNYAKEHPGWHHHVTTLPGGITRLDITTPTKHRYRSRPPGLPPPATGIEAELCRIIAAA